MSAKSVTLPKGTRDFGPEVLQKRNHIINSIRAVFQLYGFAPIETPSMENLSTLMGKYGEEGDKLIFKVLNSGDYLKSIPEADFPIQKEANRTHLSNLITEKALRYDLTIPFARFVVMHQHEITFPFKRYQIQPVWRADRPQKSRYREFYQCDADVVGTRSLISEVEFINIYQEVFKRLGVPVQVKVNNRKLLAGLAEVAQLDATQFTSMVIGIDKLDKIGWEGVEKELLTRKIPKASVSIIKDYLGGMEFSQLSQFFESSEIGSKGVKEITYLSEYFSDQVVFDPTLARGLDYYTGTIFEVKALDVSIGSIGGGGRYDDLTGLFGLKDISGVGISFGLDRIYDVMETLGLLKEVPPTTTQLLFTNFNQLTENFAMRLADHTRKHGINTEVYPEQDKLKKQFKYADQKRIPYVAIIGPEEIQKQAVSLKNMVTGEQKELSVEALVKELI